MNVIRKGSRHRRASRLFYGLALLAAVSLCFSAPASALEINDNWNGDAFGTGDRWSHSGSVSGGNVTVNSGQVNGNISGGSTADGNATGNSVVINGGTVSGTGSSYIYGGDTPNGNAANNSITVNGGTIYVDDFLTGGTDDGDATGNSVTVNGGTINVTDITGGSSENGTASGNTLTIRDGSVTASGYVTGGGTVSGNARDNKVVIEGGIVTANHIIGGGTDLDNEAGTTVVSGNSVTISGGTVTADDIAGGYSKRGAVTGNSATINGGTVHGGDGIYGGKTYKGDAVNNTLTVNGGTVTGNINAGKTKDGNATGNSAIINGGAISVVSINGGNTDKGDATNNSVTIYRGTLNLSNDILGGGTDNGNATGNSVTIHDGSIITEYVVGGWSDNGNAMNNSVTIHGGTITAEQIIGGGNEYGRGNASDNSVTINGGDVSAEDIAGGFTRDGAVTGNSATINGGTVHGSDGIYGGKTYKGDAVNNTLTVNGGTVTGNINAGMTRDGNATGNSAVINDGTISVVSINGGSTDKGDATNNSVTIYRGTLNLGDDILGGGTDNGNATGNTVTIHGGSIAAQVVVGGGSDNGNASGNSVNINGGTITTHASGFIAGGWAKGSGNVAANDNTVSISGGTVTGDVYGGWAHSTGGVGSASGNLVQITGGTVTGTIYGGFVNTGPNDMAINNRVTISGRPNLAGADLVGGNAGQGNSFMGNTLVVATDRPLTVKSVASVENYEFVLPANTSSGYTALTAVDSIVFGDGNGNPSKVTGIRIAGGGSALNVGDEIRLFDSLSGPIIYGNLGIAPGTTLSGSKGVSLLYRYSLENGMATVSGVQAHPQAKALSEGRLAGLAFVNQGADLIAGAGIRTAAAAQNGTGIGLAPFFTAQGGTSRYDTGSHVDVDGFSFMTGLAWNTHTDYGKLLLGAFFEAGWGNYDSHNSFSNYASVKGDGDTEYYGGGILGRFDFAPTGPGNMYTEASFRAGWSETDFSSDDLRDVTDRKADYDSGSAYYGAHLGLGYIWNISDASSLDLHTKYFWTHQDSDRVSVTGDPVKFKSADSHRWRGGARFSHTLNTESGLTFTPYIGAAYEHEFDGEAKATVYGYSIDKPDLKGGTGIGELGFSFKPVADSGLSFDLGVQGYTGVREGVTGSFQLKWEF